MYSTLCEQNSTTSHLIEGWTGLSGPLIEGYTDLSRYRGGRDEVYVVGEDFTGGPRAESDPRCDSGPRGSAPHGDERRVFVSAKGRPSVVDDLRPGEILRV